jgi:hypothetical protein
MRRRAICSSGSPRGALQRSQNVMSDVLIAFAVEAGSPNLIAIRFSRSPLSSFPFGIIRSSPIVFSQPVHGQDLLDKEAR